MNILDEVLGVQGGDAVRHLGRQFDLQVEKAKAAVSALVPALADGFKKNASTPDGMDGLMTALQDGRHERYVDDTSTLERPETVDDGNGILGHVLGSKDVSREVATQAAAQTGVGKSVLKRMLPLVAAMVMGLLAKRARQPNDQPANRARSILDLLGGGGRFGQAFGR